MKAREYLQLSARLFQMRGKEGQQRIEEMLELVGLADSAGRRIGGFSGGMLQRLGLAQALLHRPPVLFLDEPLSSLDPAGRYDVLALLEELRSETTIFLSSHILADIERICDTIGIIHEGELILMADREELLAKYAPSALRLELERESVPALPAFVADLERRSWVSGVTIQEAVVRIAVAEREPAMREILPAVVEHGLQLTSYEWVRPSLEEIFLRVSQ